MGGSPSIADARRYRGSLGAESAARAKHARIFGLATSGREQLPTVEDDEERAAEDWALGSDEIAPSASNAIDDVNQEGVIENRWKELD